MDLLLYLLFFLISILYSSVGFGGGSSYIAILILWNVSPITVTIIAALCNIVVTFNSSVLYFKNKIITLKEIAPFIIGSIPFSFLGGVTKLPIQYFCILLGCFLFASSLLLIVQAILSFKNEENINTIQNKTKGIIGASLGYISGLTGIGGGIFLSPILHLSKTMTIRKISAITASFIFVNAISGLLGRLLSTSIDKDTIHYIAYLPLAVLLGSIIGTRLFLHSKYTRLIKFIVAIIISLAAWNILSKYL